MRREKPHWFLVALAYLIPVLIIVVVGAVSCGVFLSKPDFGDPCALPGQYTVRPQDGQRLKCIKDGRNGKIYWLPVDSKEGK